MAVEQQAAADAEAPRRRPTAPPRPPVAPAKRTAARSRRCRGMGFPAMGEPFIVCDNLVKIYKVADLEVVALQGLDLTVNRGELMAIIGNSGSGKSTLLNILGGLDRPSAGRVSVGNRDLLKMDDRDMVLYKREVVGFVWQQSSRNLIPYLTALENVQVPMIIAGKSAGGAEGLGRGAAGRRRPGAPQGAPPLPALRGRAAARRHRHRPGQPPAPAAGGRADG